MQMIATITSKRQLTIPIAVYNRLGFASSKKVLLRTDGQSLTIQPAVALVDSLAGSLKIPVKYKGKSEDEIIRIAKRAYFKKKS